MHPKMRSSILRPSGGLIVDGRFYGLGFHGLGLPWLGFGFNSALKAYGGFIGLGLLWVKFKP